VLFDLDGTLIFSSDAIRGGISATLVEFGYDPLGPDNIKRFVGVSLGAAFRHWTDDPQPMIERYKEIYMSTFKEKTTVYNGVVELLDAIHGRVQSGIITLKSNQNTRIVLDEMGLGKYFTDLYGDDGPEKARYLIKPDPGHFFFAMHDMGLIDDETYSGLADEKDLRGKQPPFNASHILYLGDTETDMKGALRAGLKPVGATWGLREKQKLVDAGAYTTVDSPLEFLILLEEWGFLSS